MARKKRRADGRMEIKRKMPDGKVRHFLGQTAKECEDKYRQALVDFNARQEASALFENVAADWWADYQKRIKPGTGKTYEAHYQRCLAAFSGRQMKEITPGMVDNFGQKLKAEGRAESTIKNARSVLSLIFRFWCLRDNEVYNPVSVVRAPKGAPKKERLPPTPAQIALVRAHPEGFGLCAWLFMYTGCRLGEVVALQWRDVDFASGWISVTKSASWKGGGVRISTPKTRNSVRKVPLLDPLRVVLEPRRGRPSDYILSGGPEPLTDGQYHHLWLEYCKALGMVQPSESGERYRAKRRQRDAKGIRPLKDLQPVVRPAVTAHQFRHEMASAMYEANVGELEAQKLLGHADISTTRKIYTHIREQQLQNATDQLNAFYSLQKVVEQK